MGRINIGRVAIGGIVAGIVANAFDFVINTYLMADGMAAMAQRLNLDQAAMQASTPVWILVDVLWGILLVWTYAAMRPRFGPGPRTALVSGFAIFIAVTMIMVGFTAMGLFTRDMFIKGTFFSLVSTAAASLAGAALYKE